MSSNDPSTSAHNSSFLLPRPSCLITDDPAAANLARRRLLPRKRKFSFVPSLPISSSSLSSKRKNNKNSSEEHISINVIGSDIAVDAESRQNLPPIQLEKSAVTIPEYDGDVYRWAVIYENQRGLTMLSTPCYSRYGLFPTDPPPFTAPAAIGCIRQADISLENYPLPDGTWHWVSKCWMVDMRGDNGELQYDGFEYNWSFRSKKWRSEIGRFSAGGWVRRRRWLRLMMRPGKVREDWEANDAVSPVLEEQFSGGASSSDLYSDQNSADASLLSSVLSSGTLNDLSILDPAEIWQGDAEQDWERCRTIMKRLGRDGRKLELWRRWLGVNMESFALGKGKEKQWTEDTNFTPSETAMKGRQPADALSVLPSNKYVASVVNLHGKALLSSFIFPDSRAHFVQILGRAGILTELGDNGMKYLAAEEADFWSYTNDIATEPESEHGSSKSGDSSLEG